MLLAIFTLLLALAGEPPQSRCAPQFAPLQTGYSSGDSELDFWRKEEAGDWDGTGWLGWTWQRAVLRPVRLVVRDRPKDLPQVSEADVTVESIPRVDFAVRCVPGLRPGKIHDAGVANHSLLYEGPLVVFLGKRRYELRVQAVHPHLTDARVILTDGRRTTQVLYSADGFVDDPHFNVIWAGDLDRDGQLDLVVDLHRKYSWHPRQLLLSTKASRRQLVGEAAVFVTAD